MQRIHADTVALGQKSVRRSEHHLIPRRTLWLCVKQVRNPPRRQLADE
jgi:hypothetical protein